MNAEQAVQLLRKIIMESPPSRDVGPDAYWRWKKKAYEAYQATATLDRETVHA